MAYTSPDSRPAAGRLPAATAPPDRGLASVAEGSAEDVLGQTLNTDFSQPDFTHGGANDSANAETLYAPNGVALDAVNHRLFVADKSNHRVLVFDLSPSNLLTDRRADRVLGQADFTSGSANRGGGMAANTLSVPYAVAYDPAGNRLFVADSSNHRVLVYDTATITNGQSAVAVLGQADFTSASANRGSGVTANTLSGARGPAYDPAGNRLFVADAGNNRVVLYDVAAITDGENAVAVLGQADLTSGSANRGSGVAANTLSGAQGVTYDATANVLYVTDTGNHRTLLFNAAPTGTALAINGGAAYATSITATLTLTATGASQMQVSESASFTGASYQTYATTLPFTLTAGDGARAVYARFRDSALGVSTAVSDTILLDTTPPLTFTLASPATGAYTNTASPTFTWAASSDATSGLAKYQLYIDGALNRDNILTGTLSITPTGTLTDGLHTWAVAAVDNVGYSRQSSATNSVTVDTTPPLTFTLASPATGAYTNTATPTLAWEASSDATSSLAKYQLFIDGALNRDNVVTTTTSITPTGTLTDGLHTWNMVAVDNAANSRASTSTYTVTVDTVAPSISQVSASGVTTRTATITWTSSEAASSQVEYGPTAAYGSATAEADTSPRVISHTVALSGLTPGTTYHYRVKSLDEAGNLGVSSDGTFTTTTTAVLLYLPMLAKASSGGW